MSNYTAKCPECEEVRHLKNKPKNYISICKKCVLVERNTTHGMSGTRLYSIWKDMKKRCDNPNHVMYEYYGGRGISYWAGWSEFECFQEWAEEGYGDELELDRKDSDKDYNIFNCRWVNRSTQMQNTRKIWKHNSSGYRGVHLRKAKNENQNDRWYAQISVDNKKKHIGSYTSAIKAALAYDRYIIENNLSHTRNIIDKG